MPPFFEFGCQILIHFVHFKVVVEEEVGTDLPVLKIVLRAVLLQLHLSTHRLMAPPLHPHL
jgi:hypothetical protein